MLSSIEVDEWLRPEAESPRLKEDCKDKETTNQISSKSKQRLQKAEGILGCFQKVHSKQLTRMCLFRRETISLKNHWTQRVRPCVRF